MSQWTTGTNSPSVVPLVLPPPHVFLKSRGAAFDPLVIGQPAFTVRIPNLSLVLPPTTVDVQNRAYVSALNLPQALVDSPAEYGLQLELMRYVTSSRSRTRNRNEYVSDGRYTGRAKRGYVHPSNGPAPSGNGAMTHGGAYIAHPTILADRVTEWPITGFGQVVDVTQSMAAFMIFATVKIQDDNPANPNGEVYPYLIPSSYKRSTRRIARWGAHACKPGRFAFRYSILDPGSPPGVPARLVGPLSPIVSFGIMNTPVKRTRSGFVQNRPGTRATTLTYPVNHSDFMYGVWISERTG